jgi:hypothetical protein
MALQSSGALSFLDIQNEFGGSNPIGLNEYYAGGGRVPASASGINGSVPSSGALGLDKFFGTVNFTPGSATYTSSGTFTVPSGTTTLIIEVWGGGGGGGAAQFGEQYNVLTLGSNGGQSSVSSQSLTANGGNRGNFASGSSGGTASGGTTNTTGGSGSNGASNNCGGDSGTGGKGGDAPNGGAGGAAGPCNPYNGYSGSSPGGGGGGLTGIAAQGAGGGGAGGYCSKSFTGLSGNITFTVGAGGNPGYNNAGVVSGYGGSGAVKFTWS